MIAFKKLLIIPPQAELLAASHKINCKFEVDVGILNVFIVYSVPDNWQY
jgi:hypothetical protein